MKKIVCAFITVMIAVVFSGCTEELYERMLIKGLGVDYEKGSYQVSVRVADPLEDSEKFLTAKGDTVYDALNSLSLQSGDTQMYSHCYYVIFGNGAAQNGLGDTMSFFTKFFHSSPDIPFFVSEGTAEEIIKPQKENKMISSEEISNFWKSQKNSGLVIRTDLLNLVDQAEKIGETSLLPILQKEEEKLSLGGTKMFFRYMPAGVLTEDQTMGYLAVQGRLKKAVVVVEDQEYGKITAEFTSAKPEIQFGDNPDEVNIYVEAQCSLVSVTQGYPSTSQEFQRVEALIAKKLKENIISCIDAAYEKGCDVFSIGHKLYREKGEYWDSIANDWDEKMMELQFQVETEVKSDRVGEKSPFLIIR